MFYRANQADIGEAHWNVGIESVVKLIEKNCGLSEPAKLRMARGFATDQALLPYRAGYRRRLSGKAFHAIFSAVETDAAENAADIH